MIAQCGSFVGAMLFMKALIKRCVGEERGGREMFTGQINRVNNHHSDSKIKL